MKHYHITGQGVVPIVATLNGTKEATDLAILLSEKYTTIETIDSFEFRRKIANFEAVDIEQYFNKLVEKKGYLK